ncbi:MAG TPA: sulfatase-like hydrolase/transferase [Candidatus Polarisedimenticolaceae bacterium]|nr:sulfatase-like hydrolase/transferase [Candidatus Polarisedimenticolaceae bacterium]
MTSARVRGLALAVGLAAAGCRDHAGTATRIVLVTLDTTRADHLGCYGDRDARTPHLDALAAESVVFEQAVAPAPTTLPSHATMFTGLYPQDHGLRYNVFYALPAGMRTIAETLKAAGYATAGFPAATILSRRHGLNRGFDAYVEPERGARHDADHPGVATRPAGAGVDLALDWLGRHESGKSFVWLHLYDPHWPYEPPFPYSTEFRERPYDGEISYADAQLGRLLERLRADPAWPHTLIVVAGDHGEGLFDHGERYHSLLVYESTQRVPLIVRAPGVGPRRVAEPVGLIDLMPTVLDLAGLPVPGGLRGISLRAALEGAEPRRRELYFEGLTGAIIYGWAELKGVRYGRWKLIDSSEPELYDLQADGGEVRNLAGSDGDRLQELRAELVGLEPALGGAPPAALAPQLDAETAASLAGLGYVSGGASRGGGGAGPLPRALVHLQPELLGAQDALWAGQWEQVEEVSRFVLAQDPDNNWALHSISKALIELGRREEAVEFARRLVEKYPGDEQSYVTQALAHSARHEAQQAHDVLERGLRQLPDSELLAYLFAVAAFDAGRQDVCAREVAQGLAHHPRSARLLVLRARCEARAGAAERALATLGSAVDAGFTEPGRLEREGDFRAVVALPGFKPLVERARTRGAAGA